MLASLVGLRDVRNAPLDAFGNGSPHALHIVPPQKIFKSDVIACDVSVDRGFNGVAYAVVGILLLDAVVVVGVVVFGCFLNEFVDGFCQARRCLVFVNGDVGAHRPK